MLASAEKQRLCIAAPMTCARTENERERELKVSHLSAVEKTRNVKREIRTIFAIPQNI